MDTITTPRKANWYTDEVFPLWPEIRTRKGDEYNTRSFSFHWLFIHLWTLDAPSLEIAFVCSSHFGLGITFILPYLRGVVTIPMPRKLSEWTHKNLWRKPKNPQP